MSFRSAREARERFLQLARRAEESAPLFYQRKACRPAGALAPCSTWFPGLPPMG